LLEEVCGGLVGVVGDEIRRFFETETTQRAAGIHIPLPRGVLRLLAQFVRHDSSKLRIALKKVRDVSPEATVTAERSGKF
jgi:hypothetical protein